MLPCDTPWTARLVPAADTEDAQGPALPEEYRPDEPPVKPNWEWPNRDNSGSLPVSRLAKKI